MTTEHRQSEHDEANNVQHVNEAVVEQQHTSEASGAEIPSSPDETPAALHVSENDTDSTTSSAPEVASETLTYEQLTDEVAPTASGTTGTELEHAAVEEVESTLIIEEPVHVEAMPIAATLNALEKSEEGIEQSPVAESAPVSPEMVDAVASPIFAEESSAAVAQVTPIETTEDAPRPFTSFLAEFHQAQAEAEAQAEAHLNASMQESQREPYAEISSVETTASVTQTSEQPITAKEVLPPVDFGEGAVFTPSDDSLTRSGTTHEPAEAVVAEQEQRVEAVAKTSQEAESIPTPATQRIERPVSPLLRPAQRLRLPRHGATRHREEAAAPAATEPTLVQEVATSPTLEPPAETPKPARRYRFDRPSAKTQPAAGKPVLPTAAPTTNGSVVLTPPPATQPTPTFARVEESVTLEPKMSPVNIPAASPATPVSIAEQSGGEAISMESTSTIAAPTEHGRRRHVSERHREKEQAPVVSPASIADIAVALATESSVIPEEVAPEDLPPLEYADLQKANSRRRRRHRTPTAKEIAASVNSVQSVAPIAAALTPSAPLAPLVPVAPLAPLVPVAPLAPIAPPVMPTRVPSPALEAQAVANPYTIVSGYTVGQMNQGNEASGPFMGPEPSPARGSVNTTRDGRTVRVESQPLRTAPYPVVTTATGGQPSLPAASMNHFANIVSQAIQTQTDRMVTELRRANQSPTNVSVSLPPFPSTERVGVFVDVANLLYSARTQRIAIDFGKLLDFLRGNRRLIRAHAYCPTSPQPGDEQMFLTAVKGLGYRITTKNYKTFASGAKKADLDLDLCMDVVRIVDGGAVDCIVLVSGDSDFMPMLDYCSDHGVRVEVAAFDEAMSATLRQSCDLFVNLSMLEEIRA